jgi:lipoprotein-anchoring transpeptidase ErfK/SrfK
VFGEPVVKPVVIALAAALLLSGCATAPPPRPIASPVAIAPAAPAKYGWGYTDKAKAEMAATFGTTAFKAAESRWVGDIPTSGPTKIVISLTDQLAWVYRGDRMIAATTISSGKFNHESPVGEFPILDKQVFHRSNRYSAAPMPFMLRLNRYGVALHGGVVPGYPASHGCIRLPMGFAKKLFANVARGDKVFVEG